jgi:hypothetical protein
MTRFPKPLAAAPRELLAAAPRIALGVCIALGALAGCSDPARIADGKRFSAEVTGQPGVVLIDDMEDGTQYLLSDDGLNGLWYIYNDASLNAVQEPSLGFPMYRILRDDGAPLPGSAVPPRPCGATAQTPFFAGETPDECAFVARTWGTGQRGWGAGVGLDLNGEAGVKNPFDASAYGGIGFYVIGNIRAGQLRVNVQDARTTPESAAAADRRSIERCESFSATGAPTGRCNDHFGANVPVTSTWTWVEIPFTCMRNGGWGYGGSGTTLPSAVVGIQFQIQGADPADTGTPTLPVQPFDFAIDNLSFLDASRTNPSVCP